MANHFYLLLLRYGVLLILAGWLVFRFRHRIRALIIRLMPVRLRISEHSFRLQNRYTTLAVFLLTFSLFGLANWGINVLSRQWKQTSRTVSLDPPLPKEAPPLEEDPLPGPDTYYEEAPDTPPESPVIEERPAPTPAPAIYYLQIHALSDELRAQEAVGRLQSRHPIRLGYIAGDAAPYKVLIGPFPNRAAAKQYRQQNHLEGYVRIRSEFQFL